MDFRSASPKEKRIRLFEKFTIFPCGQYIKGIAIKCSFKNLHCYEIEVHIYEKFAKM